MVLEWVCKAFPMKGFGYFGYPASQSKVCI